jgi:adenylate kinase family enzyme
MVQLQYHAPSEMQVPRFTIIFIGMQGAGKGTQAQLLSEWLVTNYGGTVFRYETGEGFRQLLQQKGNYTAELVRRETLQGHLLPEFLSVHLWGGAFVERFSGKEHIIADGFPRSIVEAGILHSGLRFYGRLPALVLYLSVPEEVATERLLKRKRADDTLEAIQARMRAWRERIMPLLDFYDWREEYRLLRIHGERSVEEVQQEIREKIVAASATIDEWDSANK